jgi:tetratricopeptide (TPR) repeat protein
MKENYYERLGVEKTADAQQIKRAYYTLVKQYPPERFPEEYKKLRAAYTALGDERKRAEYDQRQSLPENAAFLLEQAEQLDQLGQHRQAADTYELAMRLYPDLEQVLTALARFFERQEKWGKAIGLWEKLCARQPENADYAYALALNYDHRSWRKKAIAQYRRTLELDDGNADCWVSLARCDPDSSGGAAVLAICEEGIRALGKHGKENIRLYAIAAAFSAKGDDMAAERYLAAIVRIMKTGGSPAKASAETVDFLLDAAAALHKPSFVPYIREIVETLPHLDGGLREKLADAIQVAEIESLPERGFPALFHDLFAILADDRSDEDVRLALAAVEYHLLWERDTYRPELLRLRREFPQLYELHTNFFNELLSVRDTQKLLYQRIKFLAKRGAVPSEPWHDEESGLTVPAQPIQRAEPKIGRNDPCPCGSGKKYKKCCGR